MFLHLSDLDPSAFVATEADEEGSGVRDLAGVNLDRVIWVEADRPARSLRFQIDRDSWLRVVFPTDSAYDLAAARAREAMAPGAGA